MDALYAFIAIIFLGMMYLLYCILTFDPNKGFMESKNFE